MLCYGYRIKQSQSCGGWKRPVQLPQCNPPQQFFLCSSCTQSIPAGLDLCTGDSPTSLGSCARALPPSQHRALPHTHTQLPGLQSVPAAPCPGAGHHQTQPNSLLLTPTLQISTSTAQTPLSLHSFTCTAPTAPVSIRRCSKPPPSLHPQLGSLQQFPVCLELGSPTLGTVLQLCPPQCRAEDRSTSLPCWPHSVQCSQGSHWPSGPPGHTAGSRSACCPPGSPGLSPHSSFAAAQPPTCPDVSSHIPSPASGSS